MRWIVDRNQDDFLDVGTESVIVPALDRVLTENDLVQSEDCFFASTGITDGDLLRGVQFDRFGCHTDSLVMRARSGTVRKVEAHHQIDKLQEFSIVDYG